MILLRWRNSGLINFEHLQAFEIKRSWIFRTYYLAGYFNASKAKEWVLCSHEVKSIIEGTLGKIVDAVKQIKADGENEHHVIDVSQLFYEARNQWQEQLQWEYERRQERKRREDEQKQLERKRHGLI